MKLPETFHIDGTSYGRETLAAFCETTMDNLAIPEWKRDLFSFIGLFLERSGVRIKQKTSGTTSDPKVYVLKRDSMICSARKTIQFFDLQPGDRALLCLPVHYIAGKMMVVRSLVGGLDLIMTEPSARPLKELNGSVSFGAMVPLQVHESIQHGDDLSLVKKLLIGGGELHPSIKGELTRIESTAVYESFAMTETYTHFALKRINGERPDSDFRLLDGVFVSQDKRGCLVVDVPGVTTGPVTTNDLTEIVPSGKGFRWLGRFDNVIKSGGIKIVPEMLEQRITRLIGYTCLVLPEKDAKLGEKLTLVVEYGEPDPPVDAWLEVLHAKLSVYEVPKRIVTAAKIPRNSSFKPDRIAVMRLLNDGTSLR